MLHSLQKLQKHVVLLCLYGMLSRIVVAFVVAVLLPESECKGTAFFLTTKLFQAFFQKKCTFFFFSVATNISISVSFLLPSVGVFQVSC